MGDLCSKEVSLYVAWESASSDLEVQEDQRLACDTWKRYSSTIQQIRILPKDQTCSQWAFTPNKALVGFWFHTRSDFARRNLLATKFLKNTDRSAFLHHPRIIIKAPFSTFKIDPRLREGGGIAPQITKLKEAVRNVMSLTYPITYHTR